MAGLEGLLRGRVLGGRYRIEEVIGRGGMGAVYRAVDERLGRGVAVKVITAAMGDDPDTRRRVRARFHREARAAAALPHHPNVVPVYDYGTDDELGLDYIVMELLQGHDLATRLSRAGPPPLAIALRILREAARGLAVGHRAGLIHRDVKPGNIFLAQDHDELQVRMVDFGIAKLADDEDTANQLTQDGRIPHSPAYASPEQIRGLSNLTAASDVFSLGAVGYQLLTGERPFTEADRNRMSLGMPVPPPTLRSRNPAIPTAIEEAIQKALAFDPVDRFPDAATMAAAIDRALRDIPGSPLEPYAPLASDQSFGEERFPFDQPDDDERTQILDAPPPDDERTQLMDVDPSPVAPPAPAHRGGPAAPPPIPPRPAARPVTVAAPRKRRAPAIWAFVLLALAAAVTWAVMSSGGGSSLVNQLPVPDTLPPDSAAAPQDSAPPTPDPAAINRRGVELASPAQRRYQEALALFERAASLDPTNAEYRQNIGIVLSLLGRPDEAEGELTRAIQGNPNLPNAYAYLAQIQLARGDTAAAIRSLEEYVGRAPAGAGRTAAQRQIESLRIEDQLLGEPVDTVPPPAPSPSATTPQ